jgi:predicted metallo-beta-lactamase superfamily hydrolase
MTYRELQKALSRLSESELDNDIIIYDGYHYDSCHDEYFLINYLEKTSDNSTRLPPDYPILTNYHY